MRHVYPTNGGSHLSMSRVLDVQCVDSTLPGFVVSTSQYTMKDKIDPSAQYTIDYLYSEQARVRSQMSSMTTMVDSLHAISLPTALTINECNAQIDVVEKALSVRSRKLLKRPRYAATP